MINENLSLLKDAIKEYPDASVVFLVDSDIETDYFNFALTKIYDVNIEKIIIIDSFTYISKHDSLNTAFGKIYNSEYDVKSYINEDGTLKEEEFKQFLYNIPTTQAIIVNLVNLDDDEKK